MAKVFDSSAVLAFLYNERGSEQVAAGLSGGFISSVNAAEVLKILIRNGVSFEDARLALLKTGLQVVDFTGKHAERIGRMVSPEWRARGLSLGDQACLATAIEAGLPAVTADRAWSGLKDDHPEIQLIR
jgi:ribonuclease VapC